MNDANNTLLDPVSNTALQPRFETTGPLLIAGLREPLDADAAQNYAVFTHTGHVSCIRNTIDFIFDQWLPNSNYRHATAPENALHFFERYGEKFNPQIGEGDIEIWLPIISA